MDSLPSIGGPSRLPDSPGADPPQGPFFTAGTLRRRVQSTSARALAAGVLEPIATTTRTLEDQGVRFLTRMIAPEARKPQLSADEYDNAAAVNPFLPFERALHVADASATHACVLNKYPVVDDHLLLVTRRFEHQESPLTVQDFEALWRCLLEYPSLGFYNSGTNAGASQPHKHLQLVPLPMSSGGELFPMQRLLEAGQPKGEQVQRLDLLPFAHAVVFWNDRGPDSVAGRAAESLRFYHQMLLVLSIPLPPRQELRVPRAYNLLVTRRAMLLVPRRREHFRAISLNALAFAGAFLVPDEAAFVRLKRAGPMAALRWVAPRDTSGGAGRLK